MTTAFTAGPWANRQPYNSLTDSIGVNGRTICTVWVRRYAGVLSDEKTVEPDPEGEANAHLIFAGPELYEAAARVIACADEYVERKKAGVAVALLRPASEVREDADAAMAALRTALAKARGEPANEAAREPEGSPGPSDTNDPSKEGER